MIAPGEEWDTFTQLTDHSKRVRSSPTALSSGMNSVTTHHSQYIDICRTRRILLFGSGSSLSPAVKCVQTAVDFVKTYFENDHVLATVACLAHHRLQYLRVEDSQFAEFKQELMVRTRRR